MGADHQQDPNNTDSLKASMSGNSATMEDFRGVKSVMVGPVNGPYTVSKKIEQF